MIRRAIRPMLLAVVSLPIALPSRASRNREVEPDERLKKRLDPTPCRDGDVRWPSCPR
ncbi:MAG: hypothetical protein KY397_00120 [Gemmatimonadetes bacterium]|nr:hypothetical protein [Gemmatimonadota bacterium]